MCVAKYSANLFGRNWEVLSDAADVFAVVDPDFGDDDFCKLFLNLLESFVSELPVRPLAQRLVYTGGMEDSRFERAEFFQKMIAIISVEQSAGLVRIASSDLPVLEAIIGGSSTAH